MSVTGRGDVSETRQLIGLQVQLQVRVYTHQRCNRSPCFGWSSTAGSGLPRSAQKRSRRRWRWQQPAGLVVGRAACCDAS